MKKILLAMSALSALAVAAPAAAQNYPVQGNVGAGIEVRIGELDSRIDALANARVITRTERQNLRSEVRALSRLENQYSRDGLSRQERQDLRQRLQGLRERIRIAEQRAGYNNNNNGGYDRDGRPCPRGLERRDNGCLPPGQVGRDGRWEDRRDDRDERWEDRRDDRDYRNGGFIDRNRDGYDDRDLNRDRRVDDRERQIAGDGYDRDDNWEDREGRWEEQRDRGRGGVIGGVIDNVLGRDTLRVGQRVSANAQLGAVPYEYRNEFRDGNGVYHRSDGRSIYRIDARTDVVLQIYSLRR
jgi:hypothetical protein